MGPDRISRLIGSLEGVDVYMTVKQPPKAGKQAMWIHIRQQGEKPWRKSARTLA